MRMKAFLHHLYHYAAYLAGALVIAMSIIALVLRFVIMPDIDRYKADIEVGAERALGMPVRIAAIEADWWHINPRFSLRGLTLAPAGQPVPLALARVDATLSWLSLLRLEPHLARLDIHQPSLDIRRDAAGTVFIAGIPVNAAGPSSPFPDWLLRQQTITVSEGRLTWLDEQRGAPPLVLERVNLLIHNRFGRHRLGLVATPPQTAARHLDIRADLKGGSVHNLASWGGRLYLATAGASAAALNTWSPWSQSAVHRSIGDVRFWMDIMRGQVSGVVGDVGLSDVAVTLADDLPAMTFRRVAGRMGWQRQGADQVYRVERLRVVTADGQQAEPASVRVTVRPTAAGRIETAKIEADGLRLEALTALSGALPLPRPAHDWIARVNPRGFVEHMAFDWLGRQRFRLQARFREGGMNENAGLPGFTGLSGEIDADEDSGRASLSSQGLHYVHDRVFRQPLDFDRLDAELAWDAVEGGGYRFRLERCALGNPDLDGSAVGELTWRPDRPAVIDLDARLSRGEGAAVWRYLPRTVGDHTHAWVRHSVVAGISPDTRLVLRGPLDRFPFAQGGGEFRVDVGIHDATLDYAEGWPRITGINGLLTFQGNGMTISADSGDILGVRLARVRGGIPDLHAGDEQTLTLDGQASGATPAFLAFVRQSPVNEHSGRFTEALRAEGKADLGLRLQLMLRHMEASRVNGQLVLADNRIDLGGRLPTLDRVNGRLAFTTDSLRGDGITALLYGQPVSLDLAGATGGGVRANLRGSLSAAALAPWLPAGLAGRLSGTTEVQAEATLRRQALAYEVSTDLAGLAIDLPAPLGKPADLAVPTSVSGRDDNLTFRHGSLLTGALALGEAGAVRLGLTLGGGQAQAPDEPGLVVHGNLRRLDIDAWRAIELDDGNGLPVREVSLSLNELKAFGRKLSEIHVQARPEGATWRVGLASRNIMGEIEYGPRAGQPGNRFAGRFSRLAIPKEEAGTAAGGHDLGELPAEVDLSAQSFSLRDHELGELALSFRVEKSGLRVDTLRLANPDGRIEGGGWLSASPLRRTELDLKLDSTNLGRLMKRLGYTEAVRNGELVVTGRIGWLGRPEDFALGQLGGRLDVRLNNGRFTQLDPGAGKLLGILSLQALPRRIVLDFRDVFSEGFAFDEIRGDVHLDRGIGYLPALAINGPAARIRMNGKIDLVRENQQLRLHVQPRLDEGLAVGAGLLGGPAVAVGALVASKILRDPLAKAASFEYLVSGSWEEPKVVKLARPEADKTVP